MKVWKNKTHRKKVKDFELLPYIMLCGDSKRFLILDQASVHVYLIRAHSILVPESCLNTKYIAL